MEINRIYCMDNRIGLKTLPDESIDCCITSPPYYGLRDYGVDNQIGLEKSPDEYVDQLVNVFREVKRALKPEGTLWLNLGDSYAGSRKGSATHPESAENYKQGSNKGLIGKPAVTKVGWGECKPKDLIGIPWTVAFALRADGWYLRQDIIWHKPNPMPESVTDRCTKSHEYIFLLSKEPKYYFDAEAIAEPVTQSTIDRLAQDIDSQAGSDRVPGKTNGVMKAKSPRYGGSKYTENPDIFYRTKSGNIYDFSPKRNKRSVWRVSITPFKDAHFATFPEKLIEPCILAGCPEGGCVLDPFMGAGTTAVVAWKNNRNYLGFELNPEYVKIAENRLAGTIQQISMLGGTP